MRKREFGMRKSDLDHPIGRDYGAARLGKSERMKDRRWNSEVGMRKSDLDHPIWRDYGATRMGKSEKINQLHTLYLCPYALCPAPLTVFAHTP